MLKLSTLPYGILFCPAFDIHVIGFTLLKDTTNILEVLRLTALGIAHP